MHVNIPHDLIKKKKKLNHQMKPNCSIIYPVSLRLFDGRCDFIGASAGERNKNLFILFHFKTTRTTAKQTKKKKEKEQHQMCFLIEQKQTVLHGTVRESLDISMKL